MNSNTMQGVLEESAETKRRYPGFQNRDAEVKQPDKYLGSPSSEAIQSHFGIVRKVANRYRSGAKRYGIDIEDIEAVGQIALLKAFNTFNPQKGSWYHHANGYVRAYTNAEFYKFLNCSRLTGQTRHKNHERVNFFESLSQDIADNGEDMPLTLEDVLSHPDDKKVFPKLEANDLLERLKRAKGKIHPLASDIIEMRFGIGAKQAEEPLSLYKVAQTLDMSKEGVRKIENKALAYLSSISK